MSLQAQTKDDKKCNKQTIKCYNRIQDSNKMQKKKLYTNATNKKKRKTNVSFKVLVPIGPNICDLLGMYSKLKVSS